MPKSKVKTIYMKSYQLIQKYQQNDIKNHEELRIRQIKKSNEQHIKAEINILEAQSCGKKFHQNIEL